MKTILCPKYDTPSLNHIPNVRHFLTAGTIHVWSYFVLGPTFVNIHMGLIQFYESYGSNSSTVDLGNFVPLFNFSMCSMSSIYPKR